MSLILIACILAGGEGTRLRPVSCRNPKPMTKLVTRPVLGHMLVNLKKCGISRACVTLRHMPAAIRDYFGDGEEWGVELAYFEEDEPLGTAGSAANCDFPENEEILIVSGDAVCDFDFRAALDFHRSKGAQATILLSRQENPLEYGIVECGADGRVKRFVEKPNWNRVRTDTVNTGIYILSPPVLKRIARGRASDFAKDIFPEMLRRGEALYAYEAKGYWCDIGDCSAYLRCVHDALSGRIALDLPPFRCGVCALSPIPDGVQICPPVYIGRGVTIEKGAKIGPFTVLDDGIRIEKGAVVEGSVCRGSVCRGASVFETVMEKDSVAGEMSVLGSGCVLGENACVGAHSDIRPGVRIWPDCEVGEDTVVRFNITASGTTHFPRFSPDAVMEGRLGCGITPEFAAAFGRALASVSCGTVGCASSESEAAKALTEAVVSGIRFGGEKAAVLDSRIASETAFGVLHKGCGLGVHIDVTDGCASFQVFSGDGLPADSALRRSIENLLSSADFGQTDAEETGAYITGFGVREAYIRRCLSYGKAAGRSFAVGGGESGKILCDILWVTGAGLAQDEAAPLFMPSRDGLSLEMRDENGVYYDDAHSLAAAFYFAAKEGKGEEIACPDDAPEISEEIAKSFGKRVIRPAQEARARDMLTGMRYLADGVHRAAFIAAGLCREGIGLSELMERLPRFGVYSEEIPLHAGRAAFMREAGEVCTGEGVRYEPSFRREALRVIVEAQSVEAARELCMDFCETARRLDTDIKRRKMRKT